MATITINSEIVHIVETYKTATITDSFFPRFEEVMSGPFVSEVAMSNDDAIAYAISNSLIPTRSVYNVIVATPETGYQYQVAGWNVGELQTNEVAVKVPVQDLGEDFDSLPVADQKAAIIAWAQQRGLVNSDEY